MKSFRIIFTALLWILGVTALANITTTTNRVGPYTCTTLPAALSVTFPFQASSDLLVLNLGQDGTSNDPAVVLTLNSDYTVTGGGYNSTTNMQAGTVTVVSTGAHAVQANDQIVILRNVPVNQTSSLTSGVLTAASIEKALDKQATLSQQLTERSSRSLRFEQGETLDGTLVRTARAGKVLGFDADGNIAYSDGGGGGGGGTVYTAGAGLVLASNEFSVNPVQSLTTLTVTNPVVGSVTGNAATATALQTARTINGTSFDGSGNITVTAAAGTLTGTTLASNVTASSLASGAVGTFGSMATQSASAVSITGGALNGASITGLPAPTVDSDAATKAYVDSIGAGITPRTAVVAATTANITLSGPQTIDGQSIIAGNRVMVKNQTAPEENGIYDCAAGSWSRSSDSNTAGELVFGYYYFVQSGTANGSTSWFIQTAPTVLGTDPVVFAQFSASATYTAGTGLLLTGSQFTANPAFLLFKANDLSDLASASTARTNLGLGTMATQAAGAVAITGGTITGTSISGSTGSFAALANTGTQTSGVSTVGASAGFSNVMNGYDLTTQRTWKLRDDSSINRLRFSRGASDYAFWDVTKVASSDNVDMQHWKAVTQMDFTVGATQSLSVTSAGAAVIGGFQATGGINSTNLGASTPGTGAFTTLSATIGFTTNGPIPANQTSSISVDQLSSTVSRILAWGPDTSTPGQLQIGTISSNASAGANPVATFASTGLAVTGTLSATGAITSTAATNQFLANGSSQGQITFQKGALQSVSIGSDLAGEMFFYGATEYGRWKSTGLAVSGALSATGAISTSATDGVWAAPGGGTDRKFGYLSNSGVTGYWGIEGSAGGSILGGTTAYAMVLGTATNLPLEFGVNNTKYMSLTSTGLAVTGTISATGVATLGGTDPYLTLNRGGPSETDGIKFRTSGATTGGWDVYGATGVNQTLTFYSYAALSNIFQLDANGAELTGALDITNNADKVTTKGNLNIVVNVKDYGATGDGSTNDSAAIDAAITALPSSSAYLYFPAGTYITSGNTISGKTGLTVVGDGYGVSIIKGLTGNRLLVIDTSSNVTVRGLGFNGNCSTRTAGQQAVVIDANGVLFTENKIENSGEYAVMFGGNAETTDVVATNNYIGYNFADGINFQFVTGGVIANNVIDGVDDDCIAVGWNAHGSASNIVVSGNFCRARTDLGTSTGRGIYLGNSSNVLVANNRIDTIKQYGIIVIQESGGARPTRIDLKNNHLYNVATVSGHGIGLYGTTMTTLEGNDVYNQGTGNSIDIADWLYLTIRGGVLTQANNVFARGIHADESSGWGSTTWIDLKIIGVSINMLGAATNSCIYLSPNAANTMQSVMISGCTGVQVAAGDYITINTSRTSTIGKVVNNTDMTGSRTVSPSSSTGIFTVSNNN